MKLYLPGWEILDLTIDYIELFSILTFLTIIIFGGLEYFDRYTPLCPPPFASST